MGPVVLVAVFAQVTKSPFATVGEAGHDIVEGARDDQGVALGKTHHPLGHIDAVANHIAAPVEIVEDAHRTDMQPQAHVQTVLGGQGTADVHRPMEDLLRVAHEADGGTVTGIQGDAAGIGHMGQLAGNQLIEGRLEFVLLIHRGLGIGNELHELKMKEMTALDKVKVLLAHALFGNPDILLLDEPTNHLDLPAIEWLEAELASLRSAMVLISHDRRFLQNLSRSTVWLDRGVTKHLDRGFGEFESWRDAVLEQEERDAQKLDRKIVAEEHWVRYGVTARRKRNVRRMAGLATLRQQVREAKRAVGDVKISVAEGKVSGKLVVEAEGVFKSYDDRAIVKNLSLRLLRGDRLALVGPNGAGKTTLINLLTGEIAPDEGVVKLGTNLQMATLDQRRAALDPNATLADTLTGGGGDWVEINGEKKHVIGYMRDFLFPPEQARTPTGKLSGGERARLLLAGALSLPSNFLVLDEPTNDLDLETLDLLQEMLGDYPGTILLVSHDRDFLDRVAGSVLVSEGEGRWIEYAGGYSDMVAQRGEGLSAAVKVKTPEKKTEKAAPALKAEAKRRLSFKEKHALENLPSTMEKLRATSAKLHAILDDHGLYERDPKRFGDATALLAKAEAELAAAEDQWLELEILREEIGG